MRLANVKPSPAELDVVPSASGGDPAYRDWLIALSIAIPIVGLGILGIIELRRSRLDDI